MANQLITQRKTCVYLKKWTNWHIDGFGDPILPTLPNSQGHISQRVDIGASPFCCMYWLPNQVAFHKFIPNNDPDYTLTTANRNFYDHKQVHFLIHYKNYQQIGICKPVSKSVRQAWCLISTFLFYWNLENNKSPTLFLADFSRALMIANSRAFAKWSCSNIERSEDKNPAVLFTILSSYISNWQFLLEPKKCNFPFNCHSQPFSRKW